MKKLILKALESFGWLDAYPPEDGDYDDIWLQDNVTSTVEEEYPDYIEGRRIPFNRTHAIEYHPYENHRTHIPSQLSTTDQAHSYPKRNMFQDRRNLLESSLTSRFRNSIPPDTHTCEVVIINVQDFSEVTGILKELSEQKLVIINLLCISTGDKQRVLDVVSGGTSIINGSAERVGENTFLFTPNMIKVTNRNSDLDDFVDQYSENFSPQNSLLAEAS